METNLQSRMQELGDLELALLVSIVAEQHCIISTEAKGIQLLSEELRRSCIETFDVQPSVVQCSPKTTVDEFNEAVLHDDQQNHVGEEPFRDGVQQPSTNLSPSNGESPSRFGGNMNALDNRRIAEIVVVVSLDKAPENVRVQAFELIRTKRIFTRSAMHIAHKGLLVVAVLSHPSAALAHHLNDQFCVSHYHALEDGFPHLDLDVEKRYESTISRNDIKLLRRIYSEIQISAEIAEYVHNVVVFMRNSRYVKGGVTATATRQLRILSRALAPLHNLDFVPPYLVALAARRIYPHRLILATSETERSLQWGSDPAAIKELLDGLTADDVIDDVLASVEAPL